MTAAMAPRDFAPLPLEVLGPLFGAAAMRWQRAVDAGIRGIPEANRWAVVVHDLADLLDEAAACEFEFCAWRPEAANESLPTPLILPDESDFELVLTVGPGP